MVVLGLKLRADRSNERARPRVAHVVGARPNYMKIAPVYAALERRGVVDQQLVHTGQHYDAAVNDVFFAELPLPKPDVQLKVGSGRHGE
ncbi:MAG: UDP-N-acetylglucosamine 2-epimerase, partial [Gaiellaceae bacterium]